MKTHILPIVLALTPGFLHAQQGDALDQNVATIFMQKCTVCHDDRPGKGGGDVDRLLDFVHLADIANGYFDNDPTKSYLADLIRNGDMPKRSWKDGIKWNGALTEEEKTTVIRWIERGGPGDVYRAEAEKKSSAAVRPDVAERQIVAAIGADLATLNGAELKNARYLTITNLHNQDSVDAGEIELCRQGLVKMLNSLSRSSDILGMPNSDAPNKVVPIDDAATIFRFDLRYIGWTDDDWKKVVRHYPYGLLHTDGISKTVYTLTDSDFPYMRADWFVFAASQAPLYHELVGIDDHLGELESKLGVDRLKNIREFKVARAGFGNSLVSVNNRMVERHAFQGGYYHISYDFFRNDGKGNFFDFPLGPTGAFDTEFAFVHDGGEVIYTLPNGFQAYALVAAGGKRISIAPASIVHDNSMSQVGSLILNGISCISCHYDGMKPENPARLNDLDEVRDRALKDFRRFDAPTRDIIDQLYPPQERFALLIESDRRSWRTAVQQAGLTMNGASEPIRALFDSFVRNLNLEVAASEFGVAPDEFLKLLEQEGETRRLALRLNKSGMQRQLYVEEFRRIAEFTGLGTPRDFLPLKLPYFGHNPDAPVDVTDPAILESDLLVANNQAAGLKLTVENSDARKSFADGEKIPVAIRASEECFVTALAIDPTGEVTSLLPNKMHRETDGEFWWSPLKLKANRTMNISVETVGFEFFAQAPHGATRIRVIVTKDRPLKLRLNKKMASELAQGVPVLGRSKGAGVRFGEPSLNAPAAEGQNVPGDLTSKPIRELFTPNDWATAEWTFITRPK